MTPANTTRSNYRDQRDCECGRTFAKFQGLEVHMRSCGVERRRSAAFVDGFGGQRGWDAVALWRAAGRP